MFNDEDVPRFRAIERVARRKLLYLHQARWLEDLRVPPANRLEALKAIARDNTASALTINGGYVFVGRMGMYSTLRSWITTEVHYGYETQTS